jgi:hypothetical protein
MPALKYVNVIGNPRMDGALAARLAERGVMVVRDSPLQYT